MGALTQANLTIGLIFIAVNGVVGAVGLVFLIKIIKEWEDNPNPFAVTMFTFTAAMVVINTVHIFQTWGLI